MLTVKICTDIIEVGTVTEKEIDWHEGISLLDVLQTANKELMDFIRANPYMLRVGHAIVIVNNEAIKDVSKTGLESFLVPDESRIEMIITPKDISALFWLLPLILVTIGVGVAMGIAGMLAQTITALLMPIDEPETEDINQASEYPGGQTYRWDGATTDYAFGRKIPKIYGRNRVGGNIINCAVEGMSHVYDIGWHNFEINRQLLADDRAHCPFLGRHGTDRGKGFVPLETTYDHDAEDMRHYMAYHFLPGIRIAGWDTHPAENWWMSGFISTLRVQELGVNNSGGAWIIDPIYADAVQFNMCPFLEYTDGWIAGAVVWGIMQRTVTGAGVPCLPHTEWHYTRFLTAYEKPEDLMKNQNWQYNLQIKTPQQENVFYEFLIFAIMRMGKYGGGWEGSYIYTIPAFSAQYKGFAQMTNIVLGETLWTSTQGLRLSLGINDGEIADVSQELYINDTLYYDLLDIPERAETIYSPFELQVSKGSNYPIIHANQPSQITVANFYDLLLLGQYEYGQEIDNLREGEDIFSYITYSDAVEIIQIYISFPYGLYKYDNQSNPLTSTVEFKMAYREVGETLWHFNNVSFTDPDGDEAPITKVADFRRETFTNILTFGSYDNPLPAGQYEVRVKRLSATEYLGLNMNRSWLDSIKEYAVETVYYPNTATMGLRMVASDKLSGSVPQISMDVLGSYIKVPILYETATHNIIPFQLAFTEVVDGAYEWYYWNEDEKVELTVDYTNTMYQYTNCPPFIIYDILINSKKFPRITEDQLNWTSFVDAAAYCWEWIAKIPLGGTLLTGQGYEHRFECNMVVDSEIEMGQLLSQIAALFNAKVYWVNDKVCLRLLHAELPSAIFTNADIIAGSYTEKYLQETQRPNSVEISFYDEENRFKRDSIKVVTTAVDAGIEPENSQNASLIGCSKTSQAYRSAITILKHAQAVTKQITFSTTRSGYKCLPGDIIRLQNQTVSYIYGGYLRKDSDPTVHYLDRTIEIETAADYAFYIQHRASGIVSPPLTADPDDRIILTMASGYYDEITTPSGLGGIQNDVWQLIPTSGDVTYANDVRVTDMQFDHEKSEVAFTCEPYDPSIFDDTLTSVITDPYVPPISPRQSYPRDVTNLAATQVYGTWTVNITYTVPISNDVQFRGTIVEDLGNSTYIYSEDTNDYSLNLSKSMDVYDNETGFYKGTATLGTVERISNTIELFTSEFNFQGSITSGDFIIQKDVNEYLETAFVIISQSTDNQNFNQVGHDMSKGSGYIIGNLEANRTYYFKAQAVAYTGTLSRQPPTVSIMLGEDICLPSPRLLEICGLGDEATYFTGCDVCISYQMVSDYGGAGIRDESEAGVLPAGSTTDYKITGFHVRVYDNAGDSRQLVRMVETANTTFSYTQAMNIEDQYNTFGRRNTGQRDLLFEVYQVDADGRMSCTPEIQEAENIAPSMAGYTPYYDTGDGTLVIDWSSFINDPSLYAQDIVGYKIGLKTDSQTTYTYFDVPGATTSTYMFTGLEGDEYDFFVVPYDCFGVGSPVDNYISNITRAVVSRSLMTPYIPPTPRGITGKLTIREVVEEVDAYQIYINEMLETWGFSEAELATYDTNYVYYNTNSDLSNFCSVTATDLNTNNLATSITYSEASGWCIEVGKPPVGVLENYHYVESDGVPVSGQECTINAWAESAYQEGGGIWGGGLTAVFHGRWWYPETGTEMDRVERYLLRFFRPDDNNLISTESVLIDREATAGTYCSGAFMNLTPVEELNVSLTTLSDSGHESGTPLFCNGIRVIGENLPVDDPIIECSNWRVVTNTSGSDLQIVLDNWETFWQDSRVKQIEAYVALGYYNFGTDSWEVPTRFTTDLETLTTINAYQEFHTSETGHTRILNYTAASGCYYIGETDGPILAWRNQAATNEGGKCIHALGTEPETYCENLCSGYSRSGECPYGPTDTCYGSGACDYESSISSPRTEEDINYNQYYVALGIRLWNGHLNWVTSGSEICVKPAEFQLIDTMFINNAAITTAKIADLSVTNAKVRNLVADKVWIGDYASETHDWEPFVDHCVWDVGSYCKYHNWTEEEFPPSGYFKTGDCPIGPSDCPTPCNYTESIFAINRIFAAYGEFPNSAKEYTYINGGMILTNSVKARSIQVGALPYVLDLEVHQYRLTTVWPTDEVRIVWHRGGEDEAQDGYVTFADTTGFYIQPGSWSCSGSMLPDGETSTRRLWIGAIENYINMLYDTRAEMTFSDATPSGDSTGWDITETFSQYRRYGKLPICAVMIINNPHEGDGSVIGGGNGTSPQEIINSDIGQFRVSIVMATTAGGTYIYNDDITTGIIHNNIWTSLLDLRHYTSFSDLTNYVGHGRLVLDGPSSAYTYDNAALNEMGDYFGTAWWNTAGQNELDTRLLIGRPYVDGIETTIGGSAASAELNYADGAYLWFYRQYDEITSGWVGNLELGGKLRVKDIRGSIKRDLMIGKYYEENDIGGGHYHYTVLNDPEVGINYYDVTNYYTSTHGSQSPPQLLLAINRSFQSYSYESGSRTPNRALLFGAAYDLISSDLIPDPSLNVYCTDTDPYINVARFGGNFKYRVSQGDPAVLTYYHDLEISSGGSCIHAALNTATSQVRYLCNPECSGSLSIVDLNEGSKSLLKLTDDDVSHLIFYDRYGTDYNEGTYNIYHRYGGCGDTWSENNLVVAAANYEYYTGSYQYEQRTYGLDGDSSNRLFFVYRSNDALVNSTIYSGGTWGTTQQVTSGEGGLVETLKMHVNPNAVSIPLTYYHPAVTLSADNIWAVVRIYVASDDSDNLYAYYHDAGTSDTWHSFMNIGNFHFYFITGYDFVLDSDSMLHVVYVIQWRGLGQYSAVIFWRRDSGTETLGNYYTNDVDLKCDSSGNLHLVFSESIMSVNYGRLHYWYRPYGVGYQPWTSTIISEVCSSPRLEVDADGHAHIIFKELGTSNLMYASNKTGNWVVGWAANGFDTNFMEATHYLSSIPDDDITLIVNDGNITSLSMEENLGWETAACLIFPRNAVESLGVGIISAVSGSDLCRWYDTGVCEAGETINGECPYGPNLSDCPYSQRSNIANTGLLIDSDAEYGLRVKLEGSAPAQFASRNIIRGEMTTYTDEHIFGVTLNIDAPYVTHLRLGHTHTLPTSREPGDIVCYESGGVYDLMYWDGVQWVNLSH